jgi:hypothetical protein
VKAEEKPDREPIFQTVNGGFASMSWLDISMACGVVVLVILIILRKKSR